MYKVTNVNIISVIVLIKFVCVEKISNLWITSSSNVPYFLQYRQVLMKKICDIDSSVIDQNENSLCYMLLFGKENLNDSENSHSFNATTE